MAQSRIVHATCIAVDGRAALITGPAGSGKSTLGLAMLAYGARLVADDKVEIDSKDGTLLARAPAGLPHLIEARRVGLLNADLLSEARVAVVADLSQTETDRLPHVHHIDLSGVRLPLLRAAGLVHFAPALLQFLRAGRSIP